MGKRTAQELRYHARKEREYRLKRRQERDRAIGQLQIAAHVLSSKHGYTLGQLVDLLGAEPIADDE